MMLEPVQFLFSESTNVYLQSLGNPFVDLLFLAITDLGSQPFILLLAAIIFWCFNKKTGIRLMYIVLFSAFAAIFLKDLFAMPRPPGSLHKIQENGFGFPSGHAQASASFWGYLGNVTHNKWIIFAGAAAILSVSLSRVYLGVHYAGDVAGGILFGLLIAVIFLKTESGIISKLQSRRSKYFVTLMLPAIIIAIAIVQRGLLGDQIEVGLTMASIGVGYLLEEEHVRFEDAINIKQKIKRAVIGLSIISIIYLGTSLLFLTSPELIFFKYIALGLTATFIVPLVFARIEAIPSPC